MYEAVILRLNDQLVAVVITDSKYLKLAAKLNINYIKMTWI